MNIIDLFVPQNIMELQRLRREVQELYQLIQEQKDKVSRLQSDNITLKKEVDELPHLRELNNSLEKQVNKLLDDKKELDKIREMNMVLNEEVVGLLTQKKDFQDQIRTLKIDSRSEDKRFIDINRSYDKLKKSHDNLVDSLHRANERYVQLSKVKNPHNEKDLIDKCNINYRAYTKQKDRADKLQNDVDTLRHNLDVERKLHRELQEKYDSTLNDKVEEKEPNDFKSKMENRFKTQDVLDKEKEVRSEYYYKKMNQRIYSDVPNVKRILSHLLHPASNHIREDDTGIGIFIVETRDGKILKVHESQDRQTYGKLPRVEEYANIDAALDYCSHMVEVKNYYSTQDLDERFPKGKIPTEEGREEARKKFIRWKDRGAANVEDVEF